jgi:hypothetical protein
MLIPTYVVNRHGHYFSFECEWLETKKLEELGCSCTTDEEVFISGITKQSNIDEDQVLPSTFLLRSKDGVFGYIDDRGNFIDLSDKMENEPSKEHVIAHFML